MSFTIEYERERIDVSTIGRHVPDPEWFHRDSFGHVHRFDGDELPTLEWVVTGIYWCDSCRDEHEEGEWRCQLCGEAVNLRYNFTGPQRHWIPGLASITLEIDGHRVPISPEDAERLSGLAHDDAERLARTILHDR